MSALQTGNVIAYDEKGNKLGYPVTKRAAAKRPSNNKAVSEICNPLPLQLISSFYV